MEIYIFKTNIESKSMTKVLEPVFEKLEEVKRWTVDTEDCDNVLRIVCSTEKPEEYFISLVKQVGFDCEPLP